MKNFGRFLLAFSILSSLLVTRGMAFDRIPLFENMTNSG